MKYIIYAKAIAALCAMVLIVELLLIIPSRVEGQSYSSSVKALIYDYAGKAISSTNGLFVQLATTIAGEDVANDVLKVENRFGYVNIVLAAPTTTVIKSGSGVLHLITFNKPVSTGTMVCYDNVVASGTIIGTVISADGIPNTLLYDAAFVVGLTCVTSTAAQDITVSYR